MQERDNQNTTSVTKPHRLILFTFICILLFLALCPVWSFNYDEVDLLAGGLVNPVYRTNLIGTMGTKLAWFLLLTFGLGIYPLILLMTVSCFRRLLWPRFLEEAKLEYFLAFPVFGFGMAMFLGIWPNAFYPFLEILNLRTLSGGVIGQYLTSPTGKLTLFMNVWGAALLSCLLMLLSLRAIWFYDWRKLLNSILESTKEQNDSKQKGEEDSTTSDTPQKIEPERTATLEFKSAPKSQVPLAPIKKLDEKPVPGRKTSDGKYEYPSISLLDKYDNSSSIGANANEIEKKKEAIQDVLNQFRINAEVKDQISGPQVTLFEISPEAGVRLSSINQLEDNFKLVLEAQTLRILTPIPGKNMVGIEVPNDSRALVPVSSLMSDKSWTSSREQIPLLLGKNISGKSITLDLAKAPHLLIAGTTGSGKSVCMNLLITSLLYKFSPNELRLIMVDPKVVEFNAYSSLPHLITPIINDVTQVAQALNWTINEMERRYRILAKANVRNLTDYNKRPASPEPILDDEGEPIPDKLPFIVVIIDELADIMSVAKKEVETGLSRIAAKSRAVGIHTIVATQRPDTKVITGTIKANFPVRIAFKVASHIDSMTILGCKGAESLLGYGDMLFVPPGASAIERIQCGMASDEERNKVVAHCASQAEQNFDTTVFVNEADSSDASFAGGDDNEKVEESLISKAIEIILRDKRPTTSYIQRQMSIGYNKAATIMEILEQRGVVGPKEGTNTRKILIDSMPDEVQ